MSVHAIVQMTYNGRDITGRDEDRPEWISIRAWRVIMKSGFYRAGDHWRTVFLPLHFTKAAYFRYPDTYKRRTLGYFLRHHSDRTKPRDEQLREARAKQADHVPNVFTGTLRELSRHTSLRAFQTRVTVKIPVPFYIRKPRDSSQPDIPAELTAVNSQEVEVLSRVIQRDVDANMREYMDSKTLPQIAG